MSSRTRSMANLRVVVKEGMAGTLRLHSSLPTPQAGPSSTRSRKRKHTDLTLELPKKSDRMSTARRRTSSSPLSIDIPPSPHPPPHRTPGSAESRESTEEPLSPAATEIVDNTPEDYVRTAKTYGIKVRDFAYEPTPPAGKSKELWLDPLFTLAYHDQHIRNPKDHHFHMTGRELRRLLDHGFVTQEEAEKNWSELDWERVKEFDESPHSAYPYSIAKVRAKPTAALRERVRALLFGYRSNFRAVFVSTEQDGKWGGDEETERMLDGIRVAKACGEFDFSSIHPEGKPGPTRRMLAEEEDFEQIFETPVIYTPPLANANLPDAPSGFAAVNPPTPPTHSTSTPVASSSRLSRVDGSSSHRATPRTLSASNDSPRGPSNAFPGTPGERVPSGSARNAREPTTLTPEATPPSTTIQLPQPPAAPLQPPQPGAAPGFRRPLGRRETYIKL